MIFLRVSNASFFIPSPLFGSLTLTIIIYLTPHTYLSYHIPYDYDYGGNAQVNVLLKHSEDQYFHLLLFIVKSDFLSRNGGKAVFHTLTTKNFAVTAFRTNIMKKISSTKFQMRQDFVTAKYFAFKNFENSHREIII